MTGQARQIAVEAHGDQKYGADRPYVVHLDAVDTICTTHGYTDETTRSGAYLHDVLEDTALTTKELFGLGMSQDVVSVVLFCTDEPGPNRKTRKMLTYRRIRGLLDAQLAHGTLPRWLIAAVRVKLADRLANIHACFGGDRADLFQMYKKEQAAFREALHVPGICDTMWAEYDRLLATPPEGLDRAIRARGQVAGFARAYGGARPDGSEAWTEKDAVDGGTP